MKIKAFITVGLILTVGVIGMLIASSISQPAKANQSNILPSQASSTSLAVSKSSSSSSQSTSIKSSISSFSSSSVKSQGSSSSTEISKPKPTLTPNIPTPSLDNQINGEEVVELLPMIIRATDAEIAKSEG